MAYKYQKTNSKKSRSTAGNRSSSRPSASYKNKRRKDSKLKDTDSNITTKTSVYHQSVAIFTFASAIILFCLIIIKGEHIWTVAHNIIWGLFGNSCVILVILLMYVSISVSMEKQLMGLKTKILSSFIFIMLFCSLIYAFSVNIHSNLNTYFYELKNLYISGVEKRGSGFLGGLLGIPTVYALGLIGARIFIIVLIFICLMFSTGTTLPKLFNLFLKPFKMFRYDAQSQEIKSTDINDISRNNRRTNIDIPFDADNLPLHPIKSSLGNRKDVKNEKLENLKRVFGILDSNKKSNHNNEIDFNEVIKETSSNGATQDVSDFIINRKNNEVKSDPIQKQSDPETVPINLSDITISDLQKSDYIFPPLNLLEQSENLLREDMNEELKESGQMLVNTLKSFNVSTRIINISRGPSVTRYELQPSSGVKISKITSLADDIALNLATAGVRIEAPIPGKAAVGIEVPNKNVNIVKMRELVGSNTFLYSKSKLSVVLGRDIAGNVTVADLSKMPHLLIAGSTGSGKSVCINSFIISLLYKSTPEEVRFLMIDPKVVELGVYNGIPHLLVPVVTDPRKAAGALNWAVNEMLKRYKIFAEQNVRDLASYNKMVIKNRKMSKDNSESLETMPQIVIIIDELADLMMAAPNEVEDSICRLAQMARAAGMHIVIATQRPSVDVITGIIKANIPSRIALSVSSQIDSRTIIDMSGAEKLLGRGDMLFFPVGSQKPIRIQGCYVTDEEIERVIDFIKKSESTEYDENVIEEIEKNAVPESKDGSTKDADVDPMIDEAIKCVVEAGQASTSLLQRRLRLGYARAGRIIDQMEQMGIIGPHEGSKPRQVLINYQQWLEMNMRKTNDS